MQPKASFPYLRYNPLQIFCRSKTPAALYTRQKWLHQDNVKTWKNDFYETIDMLFAGQCANGSWSNSLVPTIRALFGLHLTVRQKDPRIERGLEWLLSEEVSSAKLKISRVQHKKVSTHTLHGIPFAGSCFDHFVKAATLFLAVIFGMEKDSRVLYVYEMLKKHGRNEKWQMV